MPWSATARMMVAQPTPRSRATAATAWASVPTHRQASAQAGWVSTARGRIAAACSVQVRTPAGGLSTAPHAPAPAEHHRPAASGQVTRSDRPAARWRTAAARAADQGGDGLADKVPFAIHHLDGEDLEA